MSIPVQEVRSRAYDLIEILEATINALRPALKPDPETPVERVLAGQQREEAVDKALQELGGRLARHPYGFRVAQGLICDVRVLRGPRAETVYDYPTLRMKGVYVGGKPDHVEVECDERARKERAR